ncbi:unnamed protein product [marine sediment metagenome]|uniref:Uncharacterized protein n=1 Tax=marine sediment metagenome TaxID=412755 RepID=X1BCB1_9ZZZZ
MEENEFGVDGQSEMAITMKGLKSVLWKALNYIQEDLGLEVLIMPEKQICAKCQKEIIKESKKYFRKGGGKK